MVNHGKASTLEKLSSVICADDLNEAEGPCANQVSGAYAPIRDIAGNAIKYSGDMLTTGNSDWRTDQQFPDPYSCVTCHPAIKE